MLFALLLFPIGFAGWAVGHYTSLGKSASVRTVTVGATTAGTNTSLGTTAPTTTAGTSTGGTTTSGGGGGGNAAAGKTVFASSGCGTCHTFQPANSTGTLGPDLDKAPAEDAKADHNMALAAFIQESIVNPDAYIAKGFNAPSLMPKNFGSSLSKTQLKDLVAFILSGTKS